MPATPESNFVQTHFNYRIFRLPNLVSLSNITLVIKKASESTALKIYLKSLISFFFIIVK